MVGRAAALSSSRSSWLWLGGGLILVWGSYRSFRWAWSQVQQQLWPIGPLRLSRPLVTFDIEATGLSTSRDRVLELAAVKLLPSGQVVVKGPQRLNPGVHIPAEVSAIHNIRQEDLVGCPRFADVADEWREFLEGCDLLGYNSKKFDVPILRNEFRRCGQFNFPPLGVPVVDAFRLFCSQEPRTLSAAVRFYTGRELGKDAAHSSLGDAWATLRVLVEQVRRYPELPRSVCALAALCAAPGRACDITPDSKFQWRLINGREQAVVAFGKHQGEPLAVLVARHRDHLMWMSGQDWGDESLIVVSQALKGLLPTKEGGWEPLFDSAPPPAQPPADTSPAIVGRHHGGSSTTINGNNGARHSMPLLPSQQQEEQQQQQEQEGATPSPPPLPPPPPSAAAAAPAAAAAASGWPDLPAAAVHNVDSWGQPPPCAADAAALFVEGPEDATAVAAASSAPAAAMPTGGYTAADGHANGVWGDEQAASSWRSVQYPCDPQPQDTAADEAAAGE